MRILNSLACILSIFLLQACASKVYLEGQVRPDISYHISYGKSYQINYSVGKFREIDDEGQKILWPVLSGNPAGCFKILHSTSGDDDLG